MDKINGQTAPRPQNNRYPASGTDHPKSQPRGVVVAPPSGNTSHIPDLTILHRGFDTITLSIKAGLTPEFLAYLESQQSLAKAENTSVLCTYGGQEFHLKHHGGGGYQFLLDGGPFAATWAFKRPHPKDPWAIRINIGSQFLALSGLGRAKAHIDDTLAAWGIRFQADDVSIARADFCVDVFAPNFKLVPDHFVMHSGTGRRDHIANADLSTNGKSGRTTSVTLGKMPNRQVIVYDKRAEVIARSKTYWWAIWNDTLRRQGLPTLAYPTLRAKHGPNAPDCMAHDHTLRRDYPTVAEADSADAINAQDPTQSRVWRIEFRAGKTYLKDTWGIRTWQHLFDSFGDLIRHTGEVVRYTNPTPDPNRSRWPNHLLWETVIAEMNDDLLEMRSGADPNPMKEVHREAHIGLILKQILGLQITSAALHGVEQDGLQGLFESNAKALTERIISEPEDIGKRLQAAKDRYRFM